MWKTALRAAGLGEIRSLLSPKFFRVFPGSKIRRAVSELFSNYRDNELFERTLERRGESLDESEIPVRLTPDRDPEGVEYHDDGRAILAVYFHQLFQPDATLLDLRRGSFAVTEDGLDWSPSALMVDWDDEFIEAVRAMYRGFYEQDDDQFESGLEQLNLSGLGDILLEHFGDGDQRAVTFEMDHFQDSFHELLVRCDEEGRSLHHQFAPLGVYLATLYDHLSQLGGTYDVRDVFESGEM